MEKVDFNKLNSEEKNSGSDFFKIPVGNTRIRVLTDFTVVKQSWVGKYPNSKCTGIIHDSKPLKEGETESKSAWAWVLVRGDFPEVKIITFPWGLLKKIGGLKNNEDYEWSGYPMPYDITITNTGEGADRYSITPARQNTEVTEEELSLLSNKKNIDDIVKSIIEKQDSKGVASDIEYPKEDINPDDIPF